MEGNNPDTNPDNELNFKNNQMLRYFNNEFHHPENLQHYADEYGISPETVESIFDQIVNDINSDVFENYQSASAEVEKRLEKAQVTEPAPEEDTKKEA